MWGENHNGHDNTGNKVSVLAIGHKEAYCKVIILKIEVLTQGTQRSRYQQSVHD